MGHASAARVYHFTSPVCDVSSIATILRLETDMVSWITRKWVYGDPEEPGINGQVFRRRRSGTGEDLPSPVFFHYDDSLGSDHYHTIGGNLLFRPSSTYPACQSRLN